MVLQDSAPKDGFPTTIRYQRNLPRRGPSGAVVLLVAGAIMTYGIMKTGADNLERRELAREKTWARIHLVPLLEAEFDRDMSRRLQVLLLIGYKTAGRKYYEGRLERW